MSLDGAHVSDVIAPSERAATRGVALGHVDAGPHSVTFSVSELSPPGATTGRLDDPIVVHARTGSEDETVFRHAPVLYGRTLAALGGPHQNTVTDAPLIAWHRVLDRGGRGTLEYSVLWSHEDGGTDGPP